MCGPAEIKLEKLWSGNFDLGLDGENGSADTFNLRFGFRANRKTEQTVLSLAVDYLKQTASGADTADRLFAEGRYEWLFHDSRWSIFVHETCEYNEFEDYRVCDTADAGFGYRLIKNDDTTLIGRFGGGYSHYYGGEYDGEYYPESVFGMSLEQRLGKRQKFVATVEYAADVTNYARFRVRTQAAVEFLLAEETHLSLKIGVLDYYNSLQHETPGNDIDYAVMIMWKF
jgi:putative salt-induced outer membrane protein YdiY